jgi:hypothetical protein
MSDSVFVDTNLLIYAHEADAGVKHQIAAKRIRELWATRLFGSPPARSGTAAGRLPLDRGRRGKGSRQVLS